MLHWKANEWRVGDCIKAVQQKLEQIQPSLGICVELHFTFKQGHDHISGLE